MKIIDAHSHLGGSRTTGAYCSEEDLIEVSKVHHVDGMITFPYPEPYPDSFTMHNRLYKFIQEAPFKVWGLADVNPRLDEDEYRQEVTRAIKELGFVGIKLHPYLEATKPQDKHAVKVYEVARELKVPVLVHTGAGVPQALPSQMIPIAMKYPDVTFVLAHSGGTMYFDEAILAGKLCDNVFLEMSTCYAFQFMGGVRALGADKLLFGSDGPANVGCSIASVKEPLLHFDDATVEKLLGGTAEKVYNLKW